MAESARNDQEKARAGKLAAFRAAGGDPYPVDSRRDATCAELLAGFEDRVRAARPVTIAGRVRSLRVHGGSTFAHLDDGTGRFQLFVEREGVGEKAYAGFLAYVDLGDFLEATGTPFTTKRGERTLAVRSLRYLAKASKPLPEQWHGLADVEERYRHRELDLLVNPEVREYAERRSLLVRTVRSFLDTRGFLEVETPVLQPIPGGATARPFVTHHNALGQDFFLRIAPELYLKRLIVAGFPAVYELARCFRNEGIDHSHNPEFTQFELYAAYHDAGWMQRFFEELLHTVVRALHGTATVPVGGSEIDFTPPYATLPFAEALHRFGGPALNAPDRTLAEAVRGAGGTVEQGSTRPQLLDQLLKHVIRPKLSAPTFLTHYPIELSPLAKRDPKDPSVAQQWQFFAGGYELARAFSELNDPEDQRERFREQERLRTAGDDEAQRLDEEYLEALKAGMPPTAGLGFGVDRLTALLTGARSLKEVILFPALKAKRPAARVATAVRPRSKRTPSAGARVPGRVRGGKR